MNNKFLKAFIFIVVLAAGLRFSGITFDSLWLDEAYQSMVDATGQTMPNFVQKPAKAFCFTFAKPASPKHVLSGFRLVDPLCPPLYALLLNFWMRIFGPGDFAVRALSAVLSLSSICLIYVLGRKVVGDQAALFACFVQAVSPFDIHYAQEARMYSLMVLAACASSLSFILLADNRQRGRFLGVLYVISTWAMINTHYTGLFIWAGQMLYGAWLVFRQKSMKTLLYFAGLFFVVLLFWAPWFGFFLSAAKVRTASFYVARAPSLWWPFYALFLRVPANWLTFLCGNRVWPFAGLVYLTSALMLIFALRYLWQARTADRPQSQREDSHAGFVLSWAILPALLLWTVDVAEGHRVVEIARYLMGTAPAVYLLSGLGLAYLLSLGKWAPLVLAGHCLFCLMNNAWCHFTWQREPWRQMAMLVAENCQANDPVFVSQYYDIVCLDRYLHKPFWQIGVSPAMGQEALTRAFSAYDRFFLVTAQEGEAIRENIPPGYDEKMHRALKHGLHLRLFEKKK